MAQQKSGLAPVEKAGRRSDRREKVQPCRGEALYLIRRGVYPGGAAAVFAGSARPGLGRSADRGGGGGGYRGAFRALWAHREKIQEEIRRLERLTRHDQDRPHHRLPRGGEDDLH